MRSLAATYFPRANPSIIGSVGLNFGVRNGNRCTSDDRTTREWLKGRSCKTLVAVATLDTR